MSSMPTRPSPEQPSCQQSQGERRHFAPGTPLPPSQATEGEPAHRTAGTEHPPAPGQPEERSRISHDLLLALAAATELADGLRLCVEAAIQVAGLDAGGVYLLDEPTGELTLRFHRGFSPDFVSAVACFDARSAQARFVAAGQPAYAEFGTLPLELTEPERREGLRATALIPIVHEHRSIGCLNVASHARAEISPADRMALETIAAGAAQAIIRLQTQEALRQSENNFRAFFQTIDDLIVVATTEGQILFGNAALERKLGFTAEELARMSVPDLHPPEVRAEAGEILAAMLRGEQQTCPLPLARKDGGVVPVETRVWIGQWNGRACLFGVSKDLSAEQEAKQRFERLFRYNPLPMALSSVPDRHIVDVNDAWLRTLGFERSEVIGKTSRELEIFPASEEHGRVTAQFQEAGSLNEAELQFRTRNGTLGSGLFSGEIVYSQGRRHWLTVMVDITERKRSERLRELSAEVLRILNDPQALADATKRILDAIKRATGVDAVGIRLWQGNDYPYAIAEGFSAGFLQAENSLVVRTPEGEFCRDEHGNPCLECTCGLVLSGRTDPANPLFTPGGSAWTNDARPFLHVPVEQDPRMHPRNRCIHEGYQSVALIPIRVDDEIIGLLQLNDRRKGCFTIEMIRHFEGLASSFGVALQRLKEEHAVRQWADAFENCAHGIALGQPGANRILACNRAFARMLGHPSADLTGRPVLSVYVADDHERIKGWIAEADRTGQVRYESRMVRADGSTFPVQMDVVSVRNAQGEVVYRVATAQDITERRQAEAALQEGERRLATLMANLPGMAYRCQNAAGWPMIFVSEGCADLTGHSAADLMSDNPRYGDLIVASDRQPVWEAVQQAVAGRQPFELNYRIRAANGEVRWMWEHGRGVYGEDGGLLFLEGFITDISERKHLEQEREMALTKYRTLFNCVPIGITVSDREGRIIESNRVAGEILGQSSAEQLRRGIGGLEWKIVRPDGTPMSATEFASVRALREHRLVENVEMGLVKSPTDTTWISVTAAPLPLADAGVVIAYSDISARKRAEEALVAEATRRRMLIEGSRDGIVVLDAQGKVFEANRRFAQMLGYTAEEIRHLHVWDWDRGWPRERVLAAIRALGPQGARFESRHWRKDGSTFDVDLSNSVADMGGERLVFCVCHDITERKAAEAELVRMSLILGESQKIAHLGSFEFVAATQTTVWSEEEYRIYGLDPAGPSPAYDIMLAQCIHPDDAALLHRTFTAARQSGSVYELEHRIVRPDGGVRWVYDRAQPYFDENGKLQRYVGATLDITERKAAEAALREGEERLRLFIQHAPAALAMFDRGMRYIAASRRWLVDYGLGDSELRGRSHYDVFPEIGAAWKAIHQRGLAGEVVRADEDRIVRADGTEQWLRWEVRPWRDASGAVGGIVIFSEDITERKRTESVFAEQMTELRRWHEATLGRETRVLELKTEINRLLVAAGQPPRYASVEESDAPVEGGRR